MFAAVAAVAFAKPGLIAPLAYSAPIAPLAYSAYSPLAYSAYSPLAYSAPIAPLAYSAPVLAAPGVVTATSSQYVARNYNGVVAPAVAYAAPAAIAAPLAAVAAPAPILLKK